MFVVTKERMTTANIRRKRLLYVLIVVPSRMWHTHKLPGIYNPTWCNQQHGSTRWRSYFPEHKTKAYWIGIKMFFCGRGTQYRVHYAFLLIVQRVELNVQWLLIAPVCAVVIYQVTLPSLLFFSRKTCIHPCTQCTGPYQYDTGEHNNTSMI